MKNKDKIISPNEMTCQRYFHIYGAKFSGNDNELQSIYKDCKCQMPLTDEEGWFNVFECMKDWKVCDKVCNNHHPKIDNDWLPYINSINERFKK